MHSCRQASSYIDYSSDSEIVIDESGAGVLIKVFSGARMSWDFAGVSSDIRFTKVLRALGSD